MKYPKANEKCEGQGMKCPKGREWNTQISVAVAPVQSQLKPEAEPSLAEAQPELPSDGSHISANSGSG